MLPQSRYLPLCLSFSLSLCSLHLYLNFSYFGIRISICAWHLLNFFAFIDVGNSSPISRPFSSLCPPSHFFIAHNICVIKFINIIGRMLLALLISVPHFAAFTTMRGRNNRRFVLPCTYHTYLWPYIYVFFIFGGYVNYMWYSSFD